MLNFFFFTNRQCNLLEKGFLTEAANLNDLYNSFTVQASENNATELSVQKIVCSKIDSFYENVVNNATTKEGSSSKNLIKYRQDLIKNFLKFVLLKKLKECPHCKSVKREIRCIFPLNSNL